MKRLFSFYILPISLAIFSFGCSSSDDDSTNNSSKTFLEKYDGTVWLSENQTIDVYYLVKNDEMNPIPDFFKLTSSSDCYIMSEFDTNHEKITINKTDKLEIYSDYGVNEYYTYTFTVLGDKIHYKKNEFYNNSTYIIEYDLIKTNLSENDLKPICQ